MVSQDVFFGGAQLIDFFPYKSLEREYSFSSSDNGSQNVLETNKARRCLLNDRDLIWVLILVFIFVLWSDKTQTVILL